MSNLSKRIISAILAFSISMIVIWVGLPLMAPAYLFVSIFALREFSTMMNIRNIPIRRRSLIVATILTLPASLPVTYPGMQPLIAGVSWREALVGLFIFYLISLEVIKPNQNSLYTVVFSFFAYMYIPWLLGYTITLRYTPDGVLGVYYLLLPLLAIIASDIGAYSFGRIFGKHSLAPRISPNKTLEGAFGGLGFAILVVALTMWGLEHFLHLSLDIYDTILFSILVASASQLGDLFESLIKRWAGVKDSGDVMPGHGGVLDRIDSLLFAVPVTYYFMALIILR